VIKIKKNIKIRKKNMEKNLKIIIKRYIMILGGK